MISALINLYVNYMKPTLFIVYKQSVDVYSGYWSFSNNCLFLVLYSCHKTISMQFIATSFCLFLFYFWTFLLGVAAKNTLFFLSLSAVRLNELFTELFFKPIKFHSRFFAWFLTVELWLENKTFKFFSTFLLKW